MLISHDKLYEGHWKDVPLVWRKLYSLGALVAIACHVTAGHHSAALHVCDEAILLGAPILDELHTRCATWLQVQTGHTEVGDAQTSATASGLLHGEDDVFVPIHWTRPHLWRRQDAPSAIDDSIALLVDGVATGHGLARVDAPSLETFRRCYMDLGRPVVVTGAMHTWPALTRWNRPGYLKVGPDIRLHAYCIISVLGSSRLAHGAH